MINPISTPRPPELPTIQDAKAPAVAPAEAQEKTDAPQDLQPAQTPADGEVVISKDIGGILQDLGSVKFPTLPPSTPLPTIDTPPSEQRIPEGMDPATVRFPTKE